MKADGWNGSPGRYWGSKEEYEASVARQTQWRVICEYMNYRFHAPAHLSMDDMKQIARLLKIELPERSE
jgi:hypothetical protein